MRQRHVCQVRSIFHRILILEEEILSTDKSVRTSGTNVFICLKVDNNGVGKDIHIVINIQVVNTEIVLSHQHFRHVILKHFNHPPLQMILHLYPQYCG